MIGINFIERVIKKGILKVRIVTILQTKSILKKLRTILYYKKKKIIIII